ncbi:MAG: hypothetical protein GF317_03485 [Candidatus Lokiarchaeota archaeon]|nr:hypothetical protein [Candidatus Lokiarchaeota archaeon]MBD3198958.1 hypothetical protein [Candidatus Lokiarchaeota archaeon]
MFFSALLSSFSPLAGIGMTVVGDESYQYAISIAATFMFIWTFILLWADRKPIDRKEILIFLVPIIIGLRLSVFLGYSNGIFSLESLVRDSVLSIPYLGFILYTIYKFK